MVQTLTNLTYDFHGSTQNNGKTNQADVHLEYAQSGCDSLTLLITGEL